MHPELEKWRDQGRSFDYLGFQVFYRVEGSGPELLLIHGYPFSSFDWTRVWRELTSRFTVIAPDMLGMGFSEKPERYEYTVHRHADMHEALLAHLGVQRCLALAHDLGDSVGQELLARQVHGEQTAGPLAIESITWLNGGMFQEAYQPRLVQKLLSTTSLGDLFAHLGGGTVGRRLLEKTVRSLFGPDTQPSAEQIEQFGQILDYGGGRAVTHKVGRFLLDRRRHRDRWVAAMRRTDVPMRLIDGPFDPNSGRHMAERYEQLIPGADVVLLDERIGHWPQLEDPEGVLRHFLEFSAVA